MYETHVNGRRVTFHTYTWTHEDRHGVKTVWTHTTHLAPGLARRDQALPHFRAMLGDRVRVDEIS